MDCGGDDIPSLGISLFQSIETGKKKLKHIIQLVKGGKRRHTLPDFLSCQIVYLRGNHPNSRPVLVLSTSDQDKYENEQ